jgi:hypothetical protein
LIALYHSPELPTADLKSLFSLNKKWLDYHLEILSGAGLIKRQIRKNQEHVIIKDNGREILNYLGLPDAQPQRSTDLDEIAENIKLKAQALQNQAYGEQHSWIGVLGAFDTWPYMDYISMTLADMGYTVFTSRGKYRKIGRVLFQESAPNPKKLMGNFLREMISSCISSIVVYSVSAGHYIETDLCWRLRKKTLGVAFVRDIMPFRHCEYLRSDPTHTYSLCKKSYGTSWNCIASGDCPFKKQGISLNVIEYYIRSWLMKLVSVSSIFEVRHVLEDWVTNKI